MSRALGLPLPRERIGSVLALLGGAAMALSWLLPLHFPPWTSFYNNLSMGVALLLLLLAQPATKALERTPLAALIPVAVALIPWLQLAFGKLLYSGDAWVSTLYLFGFSVAISVGYRWATVQGHAFAILIASATLAGAGASAFLGIIQVLLGDVLGVWGHVTVSGMRAEANLAQPNNLATLLGLGAVALLLLREARHLQPWSAACVLALLIVGAAATQSRTALLFGPFVFTCVLIFQKTRPGVVKTSSWSVATATICHWLLTWCWSALQDVLLLASTAPLADRGAKTSRLDAWHLFMTAAEERPFWGWGWLQTGTAQFALAESSPKSGELFTEAHNLFLDLIVWCGYPIGVLLSAMILYWFASRLRKLKSIHSLCGWMTVALVGIHSMLELPYYYAYFLIPAGLWIGLIEREIKSVAVLSGHLVLVQAVAVTALLVGIAVQYLKIEEDFRFARFEYLRIGPVGLHAPVNAPLLSNLVEYTWFYRAAGSSDVDSRKLDRLREITERYPYARLIYAYSEALALDGKMAAATEMFGRIRQIYGAGFYAQYKTELQVKADQTRERRLFELFASLPP